MVLQEILQDFEERSEPLDEEELQVFDYVGALKDLKGLMI